MTLKVVVYYSSFLSFFFLFLHFTSHNDFFRTPFGAFPGGAKVTPLLEFRVMTSFLKSHVSCLSPWARQNFPAPLKIELALCSRKERFEQLSFLVNVKE